MCHGVDVCVMVWMCVQRSMLAYGSHLGEQVCCVVLAFRCGHHGGCHVVLLNTTTWRRGMSRGLEGGGVSRGGIRDNKIKNNTIQYKYQYY